MKKCSTCKQLKDESWFHRNKSSKDGLCWVCKSCYKKYYGEHKETYLTRNERWHREHPEQRKKIALKALKKWFEKNPEYMREWKKKNPEKLKEISSRSYAKRKRDLGWTVLYPNPFAGDELVDGHHIDDEYIVYIPKDLHRLGGAYGSNNTEAHRINLSYIVDQIYGDLR